MMSNPLLQLSSLGQSIWLDYIRRDLMAGGALGSLILNDGIRGMTSNPSIFEQAIAESTLYDDDIRALAAQGHGAREIYEALTHSDVQTAADQFRSVYDSSRGKDGYVSLEVNPHLAYDTNGTVLEARRLWAALDRPNVLIKVPGTLSGLAAIETLISEGIGINVTLLFGLSRYRQVTDAYIAGLLTRAARGEALTHVASVASFFVSRIDTLVDSQLEQWAGGDRERQLLAKELQGQAAVASAKMAYQIQKEVFGSDRFRALANQGANAQRLLWASTGTKNPDYDDLKYIEALLGPNTVNTVPLATLAAYRHHGKPALRLEEDLEVARLLFARLCALGIDMDAVTQQLEDEGVRKFTEPFDQLMNIVSLRATQPPVSEARLQNFASHATAQVAKSP